MLFDLRSRGRRTTVRGVYLGLAILMGGGLILFGVGTGVGGGGLLNAFSNGGNGNSGAAQSAQEKQALKATRLRPNDAGAWASLVQARYQASGQAGNFDSSTGSFTGGGVKELRQLTQDYQHYAQLNSSPNPDVAIEAARAYGELGNYSGAASAWETVAAGAPSSNTYGCLAVSAYAARQTRKGDLALNKALTYVSKTNRPLLKTQVQQAKTNPSIVKQQCGPQ